MKFSLFAIVAGIASLVSAQAGAAEPPKWYADVYCLEEDIRLTFPQRNHNHDLRHLLIRLRHHWHVISLPPPTSTSLTTLTEVACMCKNTNLIKTVKDKIPKACAAEADRAVFAMFFNSQCVGQAGFPITIGTPGDNKAASGASVTSGGAKPASATGTSEGRTTKVSVGVLAIAGVVAVALS